MVESIHPAPFSVYFSHKQSMDCLQMSGLTHTKVKGIAQVSLELVTCMFCHQMCEVCDPTDLNDYPSPGIQITDPNFNFRHLTY